MPPQRRPPDRVNVLRPLADFLRAEAGAGVLLVIAAIVALVWANSAWADSYVELWNTELAISLGDEVFSLTIREWINDAAMTIFFFVVGLEIKRELTLGELRDPKQASLPIIAAFGGMVVPASIYALLNAGGPGADGWGIPMATDIAIVTGVVALLGTRAPAWLKLFLLALAIVDDIGAILVIAVFYSEGVTPAWLGLSLAALVTARLIRERVYNTSVYVLLGIACWWGMHEAHVHPTLTGVAFGLLAPVHPRRQERWVDATDLGDEPDIERVASLSREVRGTVSVVEWLEHRLLPWSAYLIVPAFALANAGVRVPADEIGDALSSEITWGVILGLVVGKTVGIAGATLLAVKLRIGRLPAGVTTRYVIGAGALGGIGFTVSLFVTELAFGEDAAGRDARLGVLIASLAAAIIGTAITVPGRVAEPSAVASEAPVATGASPP
jgi:NhaA family Na+:H+ antiporter